MSKKKKKQRTSPIVPTVGVEESLVDVHGVDVLLKEVGGALLSIWSQFYTQEVVGLIVCWIGRWSCTVRKVLGA